jgi:dienelactone hydrolase
LRPYPLVVFGHGFAVTPGAYASLLRAWTRAGFIVAAPIFPLENANAPGGPTESDLVNQPRDMSLVITDLIRLDQEPRSFLAGMVDAARVAVAGQSDGGETALAVAYDRFFLDRRIDSAIILSGAKIPGTGGLGFPSSPTHPAPALLAVQGTADRVNPPSSTYAFFNAAPRPKYLLRLFGASHLGPYTDEQPQLRIVETVSIDFLRRYLDGSSAAGRSLASAGTNSGVSALTKRL